MLLLNFSPTVKNVEKRKPFLAHGHSKAGVVPGARLAHGPYYAAPPPHLTDGPSVQTPYPFKLLFEGGSFLKKNLIVFDPGCTL